MKTRFCALSALTAICVVLVASDEVQAAFVEPVTWNVGDPGSTYQFWEGGGSSVVPITTNVVHTANPALSPPTLAINPPGFIASSGGSYSFSTDYSFKADVSNHGGVGGTWVRVQNGSTLNPDYDPEGDSSGGSLYRDTITILDSVGGVLAVSNPLDVTRTFYDDDYPLFGGVGYEELLWEVFLPGYTGDFSVTADIVVHSGLQSLRVDSMVVAVPEPSTVVLMGMGLVGLAVTGYRRRRARS